MAPLRTWGCWLFLLTQSLQLESLNWFPVFAIELRIILCLLESDLWVLQSIYPVTPHEWARQACGTQNQFVLTKDYPGFICFDYSLQSCWLCSFPLTYSWIIRIERLFRYFHWQPILFASPLTKMKFLTLPKYFWNLQNLEDNLHLDTMRHFQGILFWNTFDKYIPSQDYHVWQHCCRIYCTNDQLRHV